MRSSVSLTVRAAGQRRALLDRQLPVLPVTCRSGATLSLTESLQISLWAGRWAARPAMPPYKRFYAGGPDTVRGYTEDTLGPVDTNGNPYGGNLLTVSRTEADRAAAGEVADQRPGEPVLTTWATCSPPTARQIPGRGPADPVDYKFSYHALSVRPVLAVQWLAPSVGYVSFQLWHTAQPVRARLRIHFPDRNEGFQFSVGQSFSVARTQQEQA